MTRGVRTAAALDFLRYRVGASARTGYLDTIRKRMLEAGDCARTADGARRAGRVRPARDRRLT